MNERDKQLQMMHDEARLKSVQDLIQFTQQSGKGGEYFISVNGMRLWLSEFDTLDMLRVLRYSINSRFKGYAEEPPKGMLVD